MTALLTALVFSRSRSIALLLSPHSIASFSRPHRNRLALATALVTALLTALLTALVFSRSRSIALLLSPHSIASFSRPHRNRLALATALV
ncbi:MAG: hypothetical protein AB7L94_33810, partial [Kofleriaceae bacterium]